MRLIFSYHEPDCNSASLVILTVKASSPLNLNTVLSPIAEQSILRVLEYDWHQDIVEMIRNRLPKVLVILFCLFLVERAARMFVKRLQRIALKVPIGPGRSAQIRTAAAIVRGTTYSIIGFLAFLQILKLFNINYAPLLASAGILGVGIGLGAQSLFKDIINGVFILVEDQFNVGEVVRVASLTGTVEDLTLRLTRLRDVDGTLHVIPNSQIATVSNLSRDYSVASLPVSVDASANPDRVMATLTEIALSLRTDAAFQNILMEDPTIPGIDKIDGRSIVYPVNLRVRPTHKDRVLRELRRRIVLTFEEKGIPLGSDGSMLIMQPPRDPTAPPSQQPIVAA